MSKTLGLIGAGNMGAGLLRGLAKKAESLSLLVYDIDATRAKDLAQQCDAQVTGTPAELAQRSDMIILAVKPGQVAAVISELSDKFKQGSMLICIAAGWTVAQLRAITPAHVRIVRVMPNMPAMVGEGMCAVANPQGLSEEEKAFVLELFISVGRALYVDEALMEAVTGVSGSGPAYAFLFIEAMADAGVRNGLTRAMAMELAAQTLLGAAKMVLETGSHPGALKDAICSPGGTTIEAVQVLEQSGFRGAVMDAVCACTDKALKMAGK